MLSRCQPARSSPTTSARILWCFSRTIGLRSISPRPTNVFRCRTCLCKPRGNKMSSIIIATEITVRYGERAVLDSATLAIDEGERIGLVGRNGCGKTTFLKLLAGVQAPDIGDVSRRRDLVVSYLPQDFMLDATKSVAENIRDGAKPVLDLIAEFESLPHDSKRHEEVEHRIQALEGWTLDQRIETAMSHLNCPAGDRRVETLSG